MSSESLAQLARECLSRLPSEEIDQVVLRKSKMQQSTLSLLWVTPVFSILALLVSAGLASIVALAMARRRIPSRKYMVVLSRILSDCFSSLVVSIASLVASTSSAPSATVALFLFVSTFSFLQITLSHIYVILLRYVSVTRPYGFQSICSIRRISFVVALGWIISLLYAAAYSPLATVILNPSKDYVCSFSGCQRPLLAVCVSVVSLSLVLVTVLFLAVSYKMWKVAKSERMHNEPELTSRRLSRFLRFSGHLGLLLLVGGLLVGGAGVIIADFKHYSLIKKYMKDDCDVANFLSTVVRLEMVSGGVVVLWSVRIIFDAIVLLLSEYRRLLPWINDDNLQPLRDNQVQLPSRIHSLQWQKGHFNRPVFNIDTQFHPWDFKN